MKRIIIIILFFATISCQLSTVLAQDSIPYFRQHTTWGFTTGPNLMNYRLNLESAVGAPDHTSPGIGAELGLFLDFHISPDWALRFTPSIGMEHIALSKNNDDGHLISFCMDLFMALEHTTHLRHGKFLIAAGPYTHFVLASTLYGSQELTNPYSRIIANDPRTEQPYFALGDFNAGLALSAGYQFDSMWLLQFDIKYGVTDLLNTDSHRLYVRPFKAVISIGKRFN